MKRALIGHTGFVGSNLERVLSFSHKYNSKNIEDMAGAQFDEVWCAGTSAVKWVANQAPDQDWDGVSRLMGVLREVRADRFILISTVDVFATPIGVDENSPVETEDLHPYGLHRYRVEEFVRSQFRDAFIFRLPNIYGPGFRKNVLYDLMHRHRVEFIDSEMRLQFYEVSRLHSDVRLVVDAGIPLVHLANEPIRVGDIAERVLGYRDFSNPLSESPPKYDMQTVHGALFGSEGRYILSAEDCMREIERFVQASVGRSGPSALT